MCFIRKSKQRVNSPKRSRPTITPFWRCLLFYSIYFYFYFCRACLGISLHDRSFPVFEEDMFRHVTWYGLSVSNMDVGLFWDDTAVSRCDTDLRQITEKQFIHMCIETKQFYRRHNWLFSLNFRKSRRFRLPWSTIDLVNQRPDLTIAPREVKLRFWFFAAGCRFLLHNVAIFLQTASRYESRERFCDTSMHKGRIRIDTDFHWKNTDFPHKIVACLHVIVIVF